MNEIKIESKIYNNNNLIEVDTQNIDHNNKSIISRETENNEFYINYNDPGC